MSTIQSAQTLAVVSAGIGQIPDAELSKETKSLPKAPETIEYQSVIQRINEAMGRFSKLREDLKQPSWIDVPDMPSEMKALQNELRVLTERTKKALQGPEHDKVDATTFSNLSRFASALDSFASTYAVIQEQQFTSKQTNPFAALAIPEQKKRVLEQLERLEGRAGKLFRESGIKSDTSREEFVRELRAIAIDIQSSAQAGEKAVRRDYKFDPSLAILSGFDSKKAGRCMVEQTVVDTSCVYLPTSILGSVVEYREVLAAAKKANAGFTAESDICRELEQITRVVSPAAMAIGGTQVAQSLMKVDKVEKPNNSVFGKKVALLERTAEKIEEIDKFLAQITETPTGKERLIMNYLGNAVYDCFRSVEDSAIALKLLP